MPIRAVMFSDDVTLKLTALNILIWRLSSGERQTQRERLDTHMKVKGKTGLHVIRVKPVEK